jgi:hypothetical protein
MAWMAAAMWGVGVISVYGESEEFGEEQPSGGLHGDE